MKRKKAFVNAETLSENIKAYMLRHNKKNITITHIGVGFDFVCTPDNGFSLKGEFEKTAQAAVMYIMENDILRISFSLKGDKLHTAKITHTQAAKVSEHFPVRSVYQNIGQAL